MSDSEKIVTITKFIGSEGGSENIIPFSTTNTNQVIMDSWPEAAFRSATYTIQMTSNVLAPDSSETSYHTLQLGLLQDGLQVFLTQYGELWNNGPLGTFDATIQNGFLQLYFTPINAQTSLKFYRFLITL